MDAASGWCKGCYRTIDEIVAWGQAGDAAKQAVWRELKLRHKQAHFPEASRHLALQEAA
jgi:uncharacterized protein